MMMIVSDEGTVLAELPEDATNGEILRVLFPGVILDETYSNSIFFETKKIIIGQFLRDWWNAKFKEGSDKE